MTSSHTEARDELKRQLAKENAAARVLTNGYRCSVTDPLYAHHQVKGSYDAADGVALCQLHHRQIDPHAR